jgi:Zn-dependent peptidase ImmA (M78 family)
MDKIHERIEGKCKMIMTVHRVTETGVPILSDEDIERCAERILMDYDPKLLEKPQPIPIEDIAENYFNLTLIYEPLSQDGDIYGCVEFFDTKCKPIYSEDEKKLVPTEAKRGSLFLDPRIAEDKQSGIKRSTTAHECGHWFYHQLYKNRERERYLSGRDRRLAMPTESKIGKHQLLTDEDWMEHQSGYFSGAILMPRTTFRMAAYEKATRDFIEFKSRTADEETRNEDLSVILSREFDVSRKAALVRINELNCGMGPGIDYRELAALREEYLRKQAEKANKKRRRKSG